MGQVRLPYPERVSEICLEGTFQMLINCPKCGFQQPEDLFCAQCGVNISKFTTKKDGGLQKFFQSKAVWTLPALVVLGAGIYVSKVPSTETQNLRAKASQVKSQTLASQTSNSRGVASSPTEDSAYETSSVDTAPADKLSQKILNQQDSQPPSSPTANDTGSSERNMASTSVSTEVDPSKTAERKDNLKLKVEFLEVSKAEIEKFLISTNKGSELIDLADHSLGVVEVQVARLKKLRSLKILEANEINLSERRSQIWNHSVLDKADPRRFNGFRLLLEASDIDFQKQTLKGHLEIQTDIKLSSNPGPSLKSYPAVFEISPENTFMLIGMMPHDGDLKLNEEAIKSVASLGILKSNSFRSGQTEFLILIYLE